MTDNRCYRNQQDRLPEVGDRVLDPDELAQGGAARYGLIAHLGENGETIVHWDNNSSTAQMPDRLLLAAGADEQTSAVCLVEIPLSWREFTSTLEADGEPLSAQLVAERLGEGGRVHQVKVADEIR